MTAVRCSPKVSKCVHSLKLLCTNLYRRSTVAEAYAFAAIRGVASRDVEDDSETREAESELDGLSSVVAEPLRAAAFFLGGGNSGHVHCTGQNLFLSHLQNAELWTDLTLTIGTTRAFGFGFIALH